MFQIEKKGYNQKQVGEYVAKTEQILSDLRAKIIEQNQELLKLKSDVLSLSRKLEQKETTISEAISNESVNKKLFDIEVQKVISFSKKWNNALNKIKKDYGLTDILEEQAIQFKHDLKQITEKVIESDILEKEKQKKLAQDKIYHKKLLDRMSGVLHNASVNSSLEKAPADDDETEEKEIKRYEEPASLKAGESPEKPNSTEKKQYEYVGLLDKYLSTGDIDESTVYAQKLYLNNNSEAKSKEEKFNIPDYFPEPNETGFDLRAAVNPKETMKDIMSEFDFYNPTVAEGKKKKKGK